MKDQVERRKHKRFLVQEGVFVSIKPSDTGVGRVINISMGGLSFDYVTYEASSINATKVDIFVADGGLRVYGVPCKTVWDVINCEVTKKSLQKRQCGVQFGELSAQQISQIEFLIHNYTIGEV